MFEVANRTAICGLALSLGAAIGCKDHAPSEPPAASSAPVLPAAPHDGVTLVSAGDEPRQPLRYQLRKGDRTTSELVWDFTAKTDGKADPLPTLLLELETTVVDVAAGGAAQLRVSVVKAAARPKPGMQAPGDAFQAELAAMQGVSLTETLAADGQLSHGALDAPQASEAVRGRLDALAHSLEQAAMRLPGEPVGANASWRERKTLPGGGIKAVADTTYTLTSRTGSIATYAAASVASGEPQHLEQEGLVVEVTKIAGVAETKGAVDLAHYAPQIKASSLFSTTLDVKAPPGTPGAGASTIEITTALDVAPVSLQGAQSTP
ncbi:MAG TPA: hypothetical protein VGC42_04235 [Kofleriaceae bacterium]